MRRRGADAAIGKAVEEIRGEIGGLAQERAAVGHAKPRGCRNVLADHRIGRRHGRSSASGRSPRDGPPGRRVVPGPGGPQRTAMTVGGPVEWPPRPFA